MYRLYLKLYPFQSNRLLVFGRRYDEFDIIQTRLFEQQPNTELI